MGIFYDGFVALIGKQVILVHEIHTLPGQRESWMALMKDDIRDGQCPRTVFLAEAVHHELTSSLSSNRTCLVYQLH